MYAPTIYVWVSVKDGEKTEQNDIDDDDENNNSEWNYIRRRKTKTEPVNMRNSENIMTDH